MSTYDLPARQLLEHFIGGGPVRPSYMFAPYTDKNIGRSYGLRWRLEKREIIPGSKSQHRPGRIELRMAAAPKAGKYTPHQGKRECARRLAKQRSN